MNRLERARLDLVATIRDEMPFIIFEQAGLIRSLNAHHMRLQPFHLSMPDHVRQISSHPVLTEAPHCNSAEPGPGSSQLRHSLRRRVGARHPCSPEWAQPELCQPRQRHGWARALPLQLHADAIDRNGRGLPRVSGAGKLRLTRPDSAAGERMKSASEGSSRHGFLRSRPPGGEAGSSKSSQQLVSPRRAAQVSPTSVIPTHRDFRDEGTRKAKTVAFASTTDDLLASGSGILIPPPPIFFPPGSAETHSQAEFRRARSLQNDFGLDSSHSSKLKLFAIVVSCGVLLCCGVS